MSRLLRMVCGASCLAVLVVVSLVALPRSHVGAAPARVIPICAAGQSSTDADPCVECSGAAADSVLCKSDLASNATNPIYGKDGIITKVTNVVAVIAGVIAVFVIVIAGGQFIVSGGDAQRIQTARNSILYAVIGLVVIILARSIIVFVINRV